MEKKHLVTSSLIGSVVWALKAPDSIIKENRGGDGVMTWRKKALVDLSNSLNRIRTPFAKEAQQGVTFENKVYKTVNEGVLDRGSHHFQRVCREVEGFEFQKKKGVNVEIGGMECYLYGKFDAFNDSRKYIKDLKTTWKYNFNKYLDTIQHKLYCYIAGEGFDVFDYVVVEWEKYPKINDVFFERFRVHDREKLERELFLEVEDCLEAIKDFGLWEAYREKFCLY